MLNITNPGQGYTDPPIVTFQDSCNHGYGAYGRAVIDQIPTSPTFGQITSVVVTSEGENYPVESDEEVFYIVDVIVEDPGMIMIPMIQLKSLIILKYLITSN